MALSVRKASCEDIPRIMTVLESAKGTMRASGNMNQWVNGYPSENVIGADVDSGVGFVVEEGEVVGYFAFIPSPEPTYARIYEGEWLDDSRPYHVIHRIGGFQGVHGVFSAMLRWCASVEGNIRIDTHRDNHIMQSLMEKHGFTYCGIIYLADGAERLAYQRIESL